MSTLKTIAIAGAVAVGIYLVAKRFAPQPKPTTLGSSAGQVIDGIGGILEIFKKPAPKGAATPTSTIVADDSVYGSTYARTSGLGLQPQAPTNRERVASGSVGSFYSTLG